MLVYRVVSTINPKEVLQRMKVVAKKTTKTLYGSEKCYRVATVLLVLYESGEKETLVADIAAKANISQAITRVWINKLSHSGFIEAIRYADRKDAICRTRRQILVKLTKNIPLLYMAMFLEEWENNFIQDICPSKKHLQLVTKKAA